VCVWRYYYYYCYIYISIVRPIFRALYENIIILCTGNDPRRRRDDIMLAFGQKNSNNRVRRIYLFIYFLSTTKPIKTRDAYILLLLLCTVPMHGAVHIVF